MRLGDDYRQRLFVLDQLGNERYVSAIHLISTRDAAAFIGLADLLCFNRTYLFSSYLLSSELGDGTIWWSSHRFITCGTIAGALIPELVNRFTSMDCAHVRNILECSKKGGAPSIFLPDSSRQLQRYWMGLAIMGLMAIAYGISTLAGISALMLAPSGVCLRPCSFRIFEHGAGTIAVDSYGPVTDNAQSIYELSLIENMPNVKSDIKKDFGFEPNFDNAKAFLERRRCGQYL